MKFKIYLNELFITIYMHGHGYTLSRIVSYEYEYE